MQASTVKNVRLFCWYLVIDPGNDANFKIDSSGKYLLFKVSLARLSLLCFVSCLAYNG